MEEIYVKQLKKSIETMDFQKTVKEIFEYEKSVRGVDWFAFYNGSNEYDEKVRDLFSHLNSTLGLNMDFQLLQADPVNFVKNAGNDVKTMANNLIQNLPQNKLLDYVTKLKGKEISKYVLQQTQKLQLAEQQVSVSGVAAQVIGAGICAVGAKWATETIKAFKAGDTILRACAAGIKSLGGITTAIAVITLVIIVVLIPFLVFMDKKAEMLMLIINRTDKTIDISDYYFQHGKVNTKPQDTDYQSGDFKDHAIQAGFKLDDEETAYIGYLYVTKNSKALYGVAGACKLGFTGGYSVFPNGVFLGFETPLAMGNNGGFISADNFNDAEDFFNKKVAVFSDETIVDNTKYKLQCRVDETSGSTPAMIAIIQSKES